MDDSDGARSRCNSVIEESSLYGVHFYRKSCISKLCGYMLLFRFFLSRSPQFGTVRSLRRFYKLPKSTTIATGFLRFREETIRGYEAWILCDSGVQWGYIKPFWVVCCNGLAGPPKKESKQWPVSPQFRDKRFAIKNTPCKRTAL